MIPATWTAGSVRTNGINIHYHRTNDDSQQGKPALICVHGITDNGLCWLRLAQALEGEFDLILMDARGHGESDAPDKGYSSADHASDLAGLITELGIEKPYLLGHSMGASTLSALGAMFPELPGKMILEDPPWWPKRTESTHTEAERAEMQKGMRAAMENRRQQMATFQQQTRAEIAAEGQKENPGWAELEFGPWALAKSQVSLNVMDFTQAVHWSDEVPGYACDTLLITSDTDLGGLVSPAIAAEAQSLNAKLSHLRIEGAGHNIRRDSFDAFWDAVVSFLL